MDEILKAKGRLFRAANVALVAKIRQGHRHKAEAYKEASDRLADACREAKRRLELQARSPR